MDNSGKPWNVVFDHHPIYSQGSHGDTDLVQQFIWNVLFKQEVDFYLSGHDHHLNALRKGDSGPYYLVSGAGEDHYRDREEHQGLFNFKCRIAFCSSGYRISLDGNL